MWLVFWTADKQGHESKGCLCGRINSGKLMCSSERLFFHQQCSNLDRLTAKSPKPNHSYKVNVWRGISYRGLTDICVFTGITDSEIYQTIPEDNLLPFTSVKFPDGFRLYQVCKLIWIDAWTRGLPWLLPTTMTTSR